MANSLLAQRLKELRKVNNYTQDYVAEVLGTTRQTYSHYETGRRKPSPETIYKLALLYGISADDLLHLTIDFDKNIFYEAPNSSPSSDSLSNYLDYFNNPSNRKKFQYLSRLEKELLYYFKDLSDKDKRELIEISKIKINNN